MGGGEPIIAGFIWRHRKHVSLTARSALVGWQAPCRARCRREMAGSFGRGMGSIRTLGGDRVSRRVLPRVLIFQGIAVASTPRPARPGVPGKSARKSKIGGPR